eukprot:SAG31_NODE_701_length_12730_cov_3.008709_5_plen_71_part_00
MMHSPNVNDCQNAKEKTQLYIRVSLRAASRKSNSCAAVRVSSSASVATRDGTWHCAQVVAAKGTDFECSR